MSRKQEITADARKYLIQVEIEGDVEGINIRSDDGKKGLRRICATLIGNMNKALGNAEVIRGAIGIISTLANGVSDPRGAVPIVGRGDGRDTTIPNFYHPTGKKMAPSDFVVRNGVHFVSEEKYEESASLVTKYLAGFDTADLTFVVPEGVEERNGEVGVIAVDTNEVTGFKVPFAAAPGATLPNVRKTPTGIHVAKKMKNNNGEAINTVSWPWPDSSDDGSDTKSTTIDVPTKKTMTGAGLYKLIADVTKTSILPEDVANQVVMTINKYGDDIPSVVLSELVLMAMSKKDG